MGRERGWVGWLRLHIVDENEQAANIFWCGGQLGQHALSLGMNNISKSVLLSCDEHYNGNVFLLFIPSVSNLFKNKMSGQNWDLKSQTSCNFPLYEWKYRKSLQITKEEDRAPWEPLTLRGLVVPLPRSSKLKIPRTSAPKTDSSSLTSSRIFDMELRAIHICLPNKT